MSLIFNSTTIPENGGEVKFNGNDVEKVYFNGTQVWAKQSAANWAFSPALVSMPNGDETFMIKSTQNRFTFEFDSPESAAVIVDGELTLNYGTGKFVGEIELQTTDGWRDLGFYLRADADGGLFFEGISSLPLIVNNPAAANRIKFNPSTKKFIGNQTGIRSTANAGYEGYWEINIMPNPNVTGQLIFEFATEFYPVIIAALYFTEQ